MGNVTCVPGNPRVDGSKAARELDITYTPLEASLRWAIQWYWDQGLLSRKPACVA